MRASILRVTVLCLMYTVVLYVYSYFVLQRTRCVIILFLLNTGLISLSFWQGEITVADYKNLIIINHYSIKLVLYKLLLSL